MRMEFRPGDAVLDVAVAMGDQAVGGSVLPLPDRLLERMECWVAPKRVPRSPADNPTGGHFNFN